MKTIFLASLLCCQAISCCAADSTSPDVKAWDAKAAAAYLDQRISWWMDWNGAARDHGTFCVSCHTAVPYALARPALRAGLPVSANEQKLLDNVTKRVRMWNEMEPFYSDDKRGTPKSAESRGTEAIFNAMILARYDAPAGKLGKDTELALGNMWALQLKTGSWMWLNFHNAPWEADDSQYYGTALAAVTAGMVPGSYRPEPAMTLMREYLVREYASQSLINRVVVLWASSKVDGLLTAAQKKALVDEVFSTQQEDGGWTLSSIIGTWKRHDGTPLETKSDGYATGLLTLALEQAGISGKNVSRGLSWLALNQDKQEGFVPAWSLNKKRDPASDAGKFMNDAATAYAALALSQAAPR